MPQGKVRTVKLNVVAKYLYVGQTWILTSNGQVFRTNGNKISMHPCHTAQANRVIDYGKLLWSALAEGKKAAEAEAENHDET